MPVCFYELDRQVFDRLKKGEDSLSDWQGAASEIADYVASWGMIRFWAMSHSYKLKGGETNSNSEENNDKKNQERRYFAWNVARKVLCQIVGKDLGIHKNDCTSTFQQKFGGLEFNQQILLIDLMMEIADSIQFWTMRMKDVKDVKDKSQKVTDKV